jgi:hypothetical protein
VVARLDAGYAFTHFHHNACAFVPQHHREQTFRIFTGQRECVGMANAGMRDFHQHFAFCGGATSISTICNGSPALKATAARDFSMVTPEEKRGNKKAATLATGCVTAVLRLRCDYQDQRKPDSKKYSRTGISAPAMPPFRHFYRDYRH